MKSEDAAALLAPAIESPGGAWADFGAGDGTFTRALAELLGPNGTVYAVDRDADAVAALERWAATASTRVIPVAADFARSFDPPGPGELRFDGMLFANSLHFISDAEQVLARLVAWLKPGGRVVVVEYDRRGASRWVPYPISIADLPALTRAAGLSAASVVATRPSMYGGAFYVAVADRPPDA